MQCNCTSHSVRAHPPALLHLRVQRECGVQKTPQTRKWRLWESIVRLHQCFLRAAPSKPVGRTPHRSEVACRVADCWLQSRQIKGYLAKQLELDLRLELEVKCARGRLCAPITSFIAACRRALILLKSHEEAAALKYRDGYSVCFEQYN